MPLNDTQIRNQKPGLKQKKLFDGDGLYLLVTPQGGKYWRLKYRMSGKEKVLALGVYPEVPLRGCYLEDGNKDSWINGARDLCAKARKQIAAGIDPSAVKKVQKTIKVEQEEDSFELVAREWHNEFKHTWSEGHADTILSRLERDVFPWLGTRCIADISPPELLVVLRRVQKRGALETAHRIKTVCGQVFRYAVATGRAERDSSQDLKGALPPPIKKHMAAYTDPNDVGPLLSMMDEYKGSFVVRCALKLAPLVFLRPGELRLAEWTEIDFDSCEWKVPIERLKLKASEKAKRKGQVHYVPLASQALEVLRDLQPLTGRSNYIFPCHRSYARPMSNNAVNAALRRMGIDTKEEMTGHGFRAMARTMLHEVEGLRFTPDAIEAQLAHKVPDRLGAAYNRTKHLAERKKMMQVWADYLDLLKAKHTAEKEG